MNEVQIFNHPHFGEIRTAGTPDEPLFCLADVCKALELDSSQVMKRLGDGVVTIHPTKDSLGRTQNANFVNEDGLYDVILDSRKKEAKAFRRWVTSEVLPSIRKHGGYLTASKIEEVLSDPDTIIKLATDLKAEQEKRRALQATIDEQAPKVLFAEAVQTSKKSILVGELAKILKQNGYDIGQNRLFEKLRNQGYLCKSGERYNQPTQMAMELGLFEIKKGTVVNADGSVRLTTTTKVTGKGQIYFIEKFLRENNGRA